ncbi:MAG: RpiB/LacA/LacB family sugar-phosphate isomerase [Bradymonadales bacterium]|nr:RpiB/LacA/LacB family sugar-phosphate isomerase [Bradymonadales bacterium]
MTREQDEVAIRAMVRDALVRILTTGSQSSSAPAPVKATSPVQPAMPQSPSASSDKSQLATSSPGAAPAKAAAPAPSTAAAPAAAGRPPRPILTEDQVRSMKSGTRHELPAGTVITPSAREAALLNHIALVTAPTVSALRKVEPSAAGGPLQPSAPIQKTIALGADHGGFPLKQELNGFLVQSGYSVVDCGPETSDPVDYPDFAYATAALVSSGKCGFGIFVDGAGIGSCMVANKVPGVLAAHCYDLSTAVNAREHNNANFLTLGGRLTGSGLAQQIVQTFLETPFGGGRHAPRVEKIFSVERRFLRTAQQGR